MRDDIQYEYVKIPKKTNVVEKQKFPDDIEIMRWITYKTLVTTMSAAGATGVGYKTFVVGHEVTKEQWAMYECLTAYCVETMEWTTLEPCQKEEGSEYWITIAPCVRIDVASNNEKRGRRKGERWERIHAGRLYVYRIV